MRKMGIRQVENERESEMFTCLIISKLVKQINPSIKLSLNCPLYPHFIFRRGEEGLTLSIRCNKYNKYNKFIMSQHN